MRGVGIRIGIVLVVLGLLPVGARAEESSGELQFVDFTYLGVSGGQRGLLMEIRTESGTAADTSVRLHSETSKKLLVKQNVGTISHRWHRFVLRVHGKAPAPGAYALEVFQGPTYSATFYFTVK